MWSNWAGDQRCTPARVLAPASVDELAAAVVAAGADGLRVRAHGSGHSFTPIALSDGLLIDCSRLGTIDVDREAGLVRAGAGVTLAALNRALDDAGMALANLGDIDTQTVAGAVSTGTHGTGAGLPSLSGLVEGVELVLADGSVRTIGRGDPELPAAQAGLGALGVMSAVTLRCEPSYTLDQAGYPLDIDRLLDGMDELVGAHDHFEFFVFASAGAALVKTRDRTTKPPRSRSRVGAWVNDIAIENGVLATALAAGRRWPGLVPRIDKLVTRIAGSSHRVERSATIFASPRLFRFTETEWSVPAEHAAKLVAEALTITRRHRAGMPLEVRWVASDEPWLSPANATGAEAATSPPTPRTARTTGPPSATSRRSWPSPADGRTGASATTRGPPTWPRATRTGPSSSRCARAWIRTAASPTPTWTGSSARSNARLGREPDR